MSQHQSWFMRLGLLSMLDSIGGNVFLQSSVRHLLFEGYEDALTAMADWAAGDSMGQVPLDKFGWFYKVRLCMLQDLCISL